MRSIYSFVSDQQTTAMQEDSDKTGKHDVLMKLQKECRNGIAAFVREAEFLSTRAPGVGLSCKYTYVSLKRGQTRFVNDLPKLIN